jgi:glycosyltransferase involved in cell wall biosynthesis
MDKALVALADPRGRHRLGAAARARVVRDFSWQSHCRALEARLQQVVAA